MGRTHTRTEADPVEMAPGDTPSDPRSTTGTGTTRAQTTLDFAIGASVFLVVVLFVVAFVPATLTPFESVEPMTAADRFGDTLAGDQLGHPASENRLNATCTAAFFRQLRTDTPTGADCRFPAGATTPADVVATDRRVNVTIHPRSPSESPVEWTDDAGTVTLAAGPAPDGTEAVTVAQRVVLLEDRTYRLVVRVW
ncbi:hypothetical protein [Halopenitus sp. POP-27]|uniref:DUF7287 family protein n=1 Tax=Halopenitus sp. POP-27 TaxID=2994425 RepID=UPI0024690932|nr:hypothetical protein [Halopenitus sp. POP-27]